MAAAASILAHLNALTLGALRNFAVLSVVFTLLQSVATVCNKTTSWWRKPDLSTDLCWTFVPNLLYQFTQTSLLLLGITICYGIYEPERIARFWADGHGPLAGLGFWPQVMIYLVGNDLLMYFTHRLFHGKSLWRFHTVHHSSRYLEWVSAVRFHPVDHVLHGIIPDVVLLLLGIPPDVLIWMMPFNVGTSALVHANLDWSFGPFRYLLASPVFHRWHHTSADQGGSSNFAGTFSLIDLVFGTFHMPDDKRPDASGVSEQRFPADFVGQLLYPFLTHPGTAAIDKAADLSTDVSPVHGPPGIAANQSSANECRFP